MATNTTFKDYSDAIVIPSEIPEHLEAHYTALKRAKKLFIYFPSLLRMLRLFLMTFSMVQEKKWYSLANINFEIFRYDFCQDGETIL